MTGLAVDVGQTAVRVRWNGVVTATESGVQALTDRSRLQWLVEQVTTLAMQLSAQPTSVGVGLSGFVEGSDAPAQLAHELGDALGAERVSVAADAVTAYLGTIGPQPGATAICGTGVAVLGFDGRNTWRRIDARGYLLGDFGGGFWIGQKGLQAALDAIEGRGPATSLTSAVERLGSPSDIYLASMATGGAPSYLAAFAPKVLLAASTGDVVASGIVMDAADHIVRSVRAATDATGATGVTGGLTRSSTFIRALEDALERQGTPFRLTVRPDAAIEGADALAEHPHRALTAFPGLVIVEQAR